jgi:hypothetical protein
MRSHNHVVHLDWLPTRPLSILVEAHAPLFGLALFSFPFLACVCLQAVFHVRLPRPLRGDLTKTNNIAHKVFDRIVFQVEQHKHSSNS